MRMDSLASACKMYLSHYHKTMTEAWLALEREDFVAVWILHAEKKYQYIVSHTIQQIMKTANCAPKKKRSFMFIERMQNGHKEPSVFLLKGNVAETNRSLTCMFIQTWSQTTSCQRVIESDLHLQSASFQWALALLPAIVVVAGVTLGIIIKYMVFFLSLWRIYFPSFTNLYMESSQAQ